MRAPDSRSPRRGRPRGSRLIVVLVILVIVAFLIVGPLTLQALPR